MNAASNTLSLSAEESRYFKLRIGRGICERLDSVKLMDQIIESRYDLCRVKVRSTDTSLALALSEFPFPSHIMGGVINYSISLETLQKMDLGVMGKGIEIEYYDGSQRAIVEHIIREAWKSDPIGYHRTPLLDELIAEEDETEYLCRYYADHFTSANRRLLFVKKDGEYAGLNTYDIQNDSLDTPLVAVLPEYRKDGMLNEFMKERFRYSREHGISSTTCGARMNNIQTQYVFERDGMKKLSMDLVIHLCPMLSLGQDSREHRYLLDELEAASPNASMMDRFKTLPKAAGSATSDLVGFRYWERIEAGSANELSIRCALDGSARKLEVGILETAGQIQALAYGTFINN